MRISTRPATEVTKEDNLYLVGPFWFIGQTLEQVNSADCQLIAKKFLVDYDGNYQNRVTKSEFTHKGI